MYKRFVKMKNEKVPLDVPTCATMATLRTPLLLLILYSIDSPVSTGIEENVRTNEVGFRRNER